MVQFPSFLAAFAVLLLFQNECCVSFKISGALPGTRYIRQIRLSSDEDLGSIAAGIPSNDVDLLNESADIFPKRVYQGSGNRVYKPRSDSPRTPNSLVLQKSTNNWNNGPSAADTGSTLVLRLPQLLIRYRVPRMKSPMKAELEILQESFKEQSLENFRSRDSFDSSSRSRPQNSEGFRDNFRDSFDAMLSFPGDESKKGTSKSKIAKEGDSKKRGEGMKSKSSSRSKDENDDDIDYEAEDDDADDDYDAVGDYYGDEENRGLSSIPSGDLRGMEMEGYSLEEIQVMLYGEYGVKANLSAIKRRLQDDKNEKRGKKTGKTRRDRSKARRARFAPEIDDSVRLPESGQIQIIELAKAMGVGGGEVVKHLMLNMGIMTSMTQNIDISVARKVVEAFGKKLATESADESGDEVIEDDDDSSDFFITVDGASVEKLPRPPVVTIMGHVDHGKTSLLDSIRKTQVAKGEAGGITQGISAFKVKTNRDQFVTFIDTPGHAAFSEMRKRGANVTDIVVLVIAADDGVMEQTKECIYAAKAAGCPIVVAINKIDKEGANIDKVVTGLLSQEVLIEDFGGDIQWAKVSAKSGIGIDDLLDKVMLQAEIMGLKAPVATNAQGSVIEARIDKGLGVVVTTLIQTGTLKVGDYVLAGPSWGRVRRIISDQGIELKEAGPSTPVQVVGMSGVPNAGDVLSVTKNEASAREVAEARQRLSRIASGSESSAAIMAQAVGFAEGIADTREIIKVPIILKGDVAGSVEALRSSIDSLLMSDDDATCKADIVLSGVGEVTSSDVAIAAASKARVLAFNVAASLNAMEDSRANNVKIEYYNLVYDLLDDIEKVIRTTLAPPPPGELVGRAEIKKVFKLGKVGKIAGCLVTEGTIKTDSQVRIMRGRRNPVYTGKFSSLKVVKDSVAEVPTGSECGTSFEDFQDFEEGDIIECFV